MVAENKSSPDPDAYMRLEDAAKFAGKFDVARRILIAREIKICVCHGRVPNMTDIAEKTGADIEEVRELLACISSSQREDHPEVVRLASQARAVIAKGKA